MAVEHVDITDPEIHEPKGVSTAALGQVYSANGAGGGSWVNNIHNIHGDMVIQANTTATAVTAAADATLATDSDYVKITAGWVTGHVDGISFSTNKLVVPVAGDYYISFWATVKVPTINNFIGIKYAINDTAPYSTRKIVSQSTTANDYKNMSASGIIASLAANDTVSIYIAGTKTDNLVVQESGLTVLLIHPD